MDNQKKLNRLFAVILAIVILSIVLLRVSEQKRVEYYICYEQLTSMMSSPDIEKIKEICHERVD